MMIGKRPLRTAAAPRGLVRLARTDRPGHFLHLDAEGVTKGTAWAWLGSRDQAQHLADRAAQRGQDWPYAPLDKDLCDRTADGDAFRLEDDT